MAHDSGRCARSVSRWVWPAVQRVRAVVMTRVLRLSQRTVDLTSGEVHGHGHLRPTELAMLAYLADRADVAISIAELHTEVWGYADRVVQRSRAAYTTASRLRAVLETDPAAPCHLLSERGEGYRLVGIAWEAT